MTLEDSEYVNESRYQRSKRRKEAVARHASIVRELGKSQVQKFELALDDAKPEERPNCVPDEPYTELHPSPWTDWYVGDDPEWYETPMPTDEESEALCKGCPLVDLCLPWALATNQSHGIFSGVRIMNGRPTV